MASEMMRVQLSKTDLRRIQQGFSDMKSTVRRKALADMRRAARPVKKTMKEEVPEKSKTLRKSIATTSQKFGSDLYDVRIGPRVKGGAHEGWYSHFVELGTKDGGSGATGKGQDANPFIERTFIKTADAAGSAIVAALNKYINFK